MGYAMKRREEKAGVLSDYLQNLDVICEERLTAQDEVKLAEAVALGDQVARNQLIEANAKLVVSIATQYVGRGLSLEDLVGEGNIGLIRAAQDFKASFGTRFSTYSAYWIKQSIRLALTNTSGTIRLPSHMVVLLQKWARAQRQLERELAREATFDEIADRLGMNQLHRSYVRKALQARYLALESTITDEDGMPWSADRAMDHREGVEVELLEDEERKMLMRRMTRLNDRERAVITFRYGLHGEESLTWSEIGKRLGMTREWARKIELKALDKMRVEGTSATPTEPPAARPSNGSRKKQTVVLRKPPGQVRVNPSKTPKSPLDQVVILPVFMV